MDARVNSGRIPIDPFADEPLRCAIDIATSAVPAKEQFDFYRSWSEGLVDLKLQQSAGPSFHARQRVWQLGDLVLMDVTCPGSGYTIRWEHRKRPILDHWLLNVSFSRLPEVGMSTGKPALRSLALPDARSSNDHLFVALLLPRSLLPADPSRVEVGDATLSFLAEYLLLLHRSVPDLTEGDLPHIVSATANLFTAALMPSKDNPSAAHGPVAAVAAVRIAQLIMEKLNDRDLTPDKLCRAAGVSRSHLYRIFEPAGGVSNYIRRKRLLKTRDALADSADRRTISNIAEEWGFTNASTYSRMFRAEFGLSPKEARELGWQGVRHSAWLSIDRPIKGVGNLGNLLINNSLGLSPSSSR
ncbi:helix-turn-helix domain-containing protein [Aquamicrobium terrae]|uniref:AraC-like DNA-binding protein n=1 Tax=Aquamicrobium terrae TaxID=1324945 RepID=A0ABV2N607_9HYPH